MAEFFYINDDIAKIMRSIIRSRFYIRLVLFAGVCAYFIFLTKDMDKKDWPIMMIAPAALFVFLFIVNPGLLKAHLKKAFQSVRIHVGDGKIQVEQSNFKKLNLSLNEIMRIEKHSKGKYFLLHTNLPLKNKNLFSAT